MRSLSLPLLLAATACRVEVGSPSGPVTADCPGAEPEGEVWVYTSMYPHVVERFEALVRERHPNLEPSFFQAGSEKVAQRVEAEWAAGSSPACVLLTSDPFWYAKLDAEGRLQPYLPPTSLRIDRSLVDPDGAWLAARLSLMVLAANGDRVPEAERPTAFSDLTGPAFRDRFTMGDPLASGTNFTLLSFWAEEPGWDWVDALQANGLVAAGGGSAVLQRLDSGERPVGAILLENLLAAPHTSAVPIFPTDGAVVIPGPVAITAGCPNPVAARAIVDLLMSDEGQAVIVEGDMYAALPEVPPPDGAPRLGDIAVRTWGPGFVERVSTDAGAIKDRWAALVSR
ncbi:MAG: extracellular solute-binding protein [Myxococcales bacterium]|nr:extracellular solute-binding protein [Myxococcales bacterium]